MPLTSTNPQQNPHSPIFQLATEERKEYVFLERKMIFRIFCILLVANLCAYSQSTTNPSSGNRKTVNILQLLWHQLTWKINQDATYREAQRYEYGDGVQENETEAIKWYKRSYKLGNEKAGIGLALIYLKRNSLDINKAEAVAILKKLSEHGNADARKIYEAYLHNNKSTP